MNYIYYFTDAYDKVIYVGKTKDIKKRMRQHFTNGHLPVECYKNVNQIFCAKTGDGKYNNEIIETILIDKYKPEYNTDKVYLEKYEKMNFVLPEMKWQEIYVRHENEKLNIYLSNPGYRCFDKYVNQYDRAVSLLEYNSNLLVYRTDLVKKKLNNIINIYGDWVIDDLFCFMKDADIDIENSCVDIPLNPNDAFSAYTAIENTDIKRQLIDSGLVIKLKHLYAIPLFNSNTLSFINESFAYEIEAC